MSGVETGLVLLVHGSRAPEWMKPFLELAREVKARAPGVALELACLQFCPPGLEDALDKLASSGVTRIVIVPVFISARGHVLRDVPGQVEAAKKRFPGLEVRVGEALGETDEVKAAMVEALARMAVK